MSAKLMGEVWGLQLTRPKRDVLLAMADNAHDDGRCWPGVDYLAWKTDYSDRQVQRILRQLEADGLVEVLTPGGGSGHVRFYRLHLEKGVKKSPFQPRKGRHHVTDAAERVTSSVEKGDTQMSPEPKATVQTQEEHYVEPPARPDVDELCTLLADRIIANGGSEARYRDRPETKAWQDPMRRLIDLDGISPDRVRKAIEWAQGDDFWQGVILSPDNLRRKYDQLRLAAQRSNGNGHHPPAGQLSERDRELARTQAWLAKHADSPRSRRLAELSAQAAVKEAGP